MTARSLPYPAPPDHHVPLMIVVKGHPAPDATVPVHAVGREALDDLASWI